MIIASDARLLLQIPWDAEFNREAARDLFSTNLLALTWIKSGTMPRDVVDGILHALGLERETHEKRTLRRQSSLELKPHPRPGVARLNG